MHRPSPSALAAMAFVLLAVCAEGCWLWPFGGRTSGGTTRLTPIEARQALDKARNLLYEGTEESRKKAVAKAESVLAESDDPDVLWNAHLVKALGCQALDRPGPARDAAAKGIELVLSSHPGPPESATLSNLKILLPVYVHNAVRTSPPEEVFKQLTTWKDGLDARLAQTQGLDPNAVENLRLEFDLLRKMAQEYYATRKPDVAALELIQKFVTYYNTKNAGDFLRLIAPNAELAERVRTNGVSAAASGSFERLYVAGPIKLDLPPAEAGASPGAATAACDLLAVSAGGWAEVRPAVVFELVRGPDGGWLIKSIKNL